MIFIWWYDYGNVLERPQQTLKLFIEFSYLYIHKIFNEKCCYYECSVHNSKDYGYNFYLSSLIINTVFVPFLQINPYIQLFSYFYFKDKLNPHFLFLILEKFPKKLDYLKRAQIQIVPINLVTFTLF